MRVGAQENPVSARPQLVWLLLTKRIGNVLKMVNRTLPTNIAIGATMATQEEYNRDSQKLTAVKSKLNPLFTFGSFEPLLGHIDLDLSAPDWIIVGGESGHGARVMDLDWARSLREQSASRGRSWSGDGLGTSFSTVRDHAKIVHIDAETGERKKKHLHDLRGTFCTKLILAGVTNQEAAEIMAWSPEQVAGIRRTYVDQGAVAVAIGQRLSGKL